VLHPPMNVPASALVRPLDKKVVIALPWYKSVSPLTAFCVAQLADKRRTEMMMSYGDAFIAHTRNNIVDAFLATDADWLLQIDDDMVVPFGNGKWFQAHTGFTIPEPFASFNAVDRLLSHSLSVVGACYWGRWPGANAVYGEGHIKSEKDYLQTAPMNVCKPTRWVGTGCLLTHRRVFTDIEAKFPKLARGADGKRGQWYSSSEHSLLDSVTRVHEMLAVGAMTGEKAMRAYEMLESAMCEAKSNSSLAMGEDVQFCIRAKQAGHQPHVDLGLVCGHVGTSTYGPK
jgi:hypothetical protein